MPTTTRFKAEAINPQQRPDKDGNIEFKKFTFPVPIATHADVDNTDGWHFSKFEVTFQRIIVGGRVPYVTFDAEIEGVSSGRHSLAPVPITLNLYSSIYAMRPVHIGSIMMTRFVTAVLPGELPPISPAEGISAAYFNLVDRISIESVFDLDTN